MSSVVIAGDSSGQITLAAPAVAGTTTLTLPATTGTVLNDATVGVCRAWVNFNGVSGSVAIRASFNVSSVTRSAAGAYVVNFTNALSDTNYSVTADCSGTSFVRLNTLNTGNIDISTLSTNGVTGQDTTIVCLAVFR